MRYLNEMLTMSPLEWLSGITIPTQCICGTNDKIVKPKQSKEIAEAIPGADLLMIDGAGHFPYLTHSEQFNAVVESFVRRQVTRQIPV
jgi:pimeloyl-ACP methyl ester carboxylesterase